MTIDRTAMRARVQLVVDTINRCYGLDVQQSVVDAAMATTQGLLDFADRYGQSHDWLVGGDIGGMIMSRIRDAGWRRKGAA